MKDIYDLNPLFSHFEVERRREHNDVDLAIIEQQKSLDHFNPNKKYYRYKLIDNQTGKLYKFIKLPKLSSSTYLIDQFNGKYNYEPAPYRKYSPRKFYWFLQRLWWNRNDFFTPVYNIIKSFFTSNFTSQLWSIIRGVIILLTAYTLWEFYKEDILNFILNIWQ